MEQTSIPGRDGQVNCGIHTFKNSLLFLLFNKKIINNETFYKLVNCKQFFKDLDASLKLMGIRTADVLPDQFVQLMDMAQAGGFDLSDYGISPENLKSLNVRRDGQQVISTFEFAGYVGEPCYGLTGQSLDLLNAAASARFMRLKGPATHVFAVGMSKGGQNGHWITAIVTKDSKGNRTWQFMDSWYNETRFSGNIIRLLEKVLSKNESELQTYLTEAYDTATNLLNSRYKKFFDVTTHTPIPNALADLTDTKQFVNAKQFYMETNREIYCYELEQMFIFMKTTGWLLSTGEVETTRKKQLYAIANYMLENASDEHIELKEKLGPICKEVLASLSLGKQNKPVEVKPDVPVEDFPDLPAENIGKKFTKTNYIPELDSLQDKIDSLELRLNIALGNGETNNYKKIQLAYEAAYLLKERLIGESETYLKTPTLLNYNIFKTRCESHINDAHKELDQHRGWTEFLVNLALGMATLGLGILFKGAINHAYNRHFLFVCKADSGKELDVYAESFNKTVPVA